MSATEDLKAWNRMLFQFQEVERKVIPPGRGERRENDVEHSYLLAMTAWYLNVAYNLGMDSGTILKYALIHDLCEVYAGDPLPTDKKAMAQKAEKEAAALWRLGEEFPHAGHLLFWAHEYELLPNEECQFVYALDKLMPRLLVTLGGISIPLREGEKLGAFDEICAVATAKHPFVHAMYRDISRDMYKEFGEPFPAWLTETGEEA